MAASSKASPENRQKQRARPPRLEWTVAVFGLLLVLAALGALTYEAVTGETSSPDPLIRVTGVHKVRGGYLAQVEAFNRGGDTAAGLTVEGTLKQNGRDIETSEATLDYLPGRSTREVGLFFTENPQRYRLELRALGYQEP